MKTNFSEKLDFLMKLTHTKNTDLAKILKFDASYISRIRGGKRGLPKGHPFIEPVSLYFAKKIQENYQKEAVIAELALQTQWPEETEEATALLARYFSASENAQHPIELLLQGISTAPKPFPIKTPAYGEREGKLTEARLFYGNEGKREAVITFLKELFQSDGSFTLLLHSNEDMFWLYEKPKFMNTWAALMGQLLGKGCSIKIIHSISRDAGDMWEAVRGWLPLYMSGAVEPWYYPRLRDGVYRRTLFLAGGHSAVISNSIENNTEGILNILINDAAAIQALEKEFNDYLSLCRPLMDIRRPKDLEEIQTYVGSLNTNQEEMLCAFSEDFPLLSPKASSMQPLPALPKGIGIYMQEQNAALIVKANLPYVTFLIREPRMVAAIQEYIFHAAAV